MRKATRAAQMAGLVIAALLLVSCTSETRINPLNSTSIGGSGVMVTENRSALPFDELVLSAAGEVHITFGAPRSVSVTVDDNIMPYLETAHSGPQLDIKLLDGTSAHDYDLTVDIVVEDLQSLRLQGAGRILGSNLLQGDDVSLALTGAGTIDLNLEVDMINTLFTGPGTIMLAGSATKHTCQMTSPGALKAFELATQNTFIALGGPGSAEVHVTDTLYASLSGIGSVFYRGDPVITGSQSSVGRVIDSN